MKCKQSHPFSVLKKKSFVICWPYRPCENRLILPGKWLGMIWRWVFFLSFNNRSMWQMYESMTVVAQQIMTVNLQQEVFILPKTPQSTGTACPRMWPQLLLLNPSSLNNSNGYKYDLSFLLAHPTLGWHRPQNNEVGQSAEEEPLLHETP